ncbi:MAG: circadian clock protein KaiC [Deinococcota bacterium]|nr:circadian clock protein KaiC [Deinococcota bacterium]
MNVEKLPTGIPGFDNISHGGLAKGRSTLVAGTTGSAKTVFASQFLAEGARRGEAGVFVNLEETPEDIRRHTASFGWDIPAWEKDNLWAFVDASAHHGLSVEAGAYDLSALLTRIEHAVKRVKAVRVAIDPLTALFMQLSDRAVVRSELYRIMLALRALDVTALFTVQMDQDTYNLSRFGVEEFAVDSVILLRNTLRSERRRRTVEILKFRGADHRRGELPFSVVSGSGINVIPLLGGQLEQVLSDVRLSSGVEELDVMTGGGFLRGSIILVSGATGTGKTLTVTSFLAAAISQGERCLIFAFGEGYEQLLRNAAAWGQDLKGLEAEGRLKIVNDYPEAATLEDHLITMQRLIDEFRPDRVAVDSLSALERVSDVHGFREFVVSLSSFIKGREITTMYTSTTPGLSGGTSVTEAEVSTVADTTLLLRYFEVRGEIRRCLAVLKMRGSAHDKDIREYSIDESGMQLGEPVRDVAGLLAGNPRSQGVAAAAPGGLDEKDE